MLWSVRTGRRTFCYPIQNNNHYMHTHVQFYTNATHKSFTINQDDHGASPLYYRQGYFWVFNFINPRNTTLASWRCKHRISSFSKIPALYSQCFLSRVTYCRKYFHLGPSTGFCPVLFRQLGEWGFTFAVFEAFWDKARWPETSDSDSLPSRLACVWVSEFCPPLNKEIIKSKP